MKLNGEPGGFEDCVLSPFPSNLAFSFFLFAAGEVNRYALLCFLCYDALPHAGPETMQSSNHRLKPL